MEEPGPPGGREVLAGGSGLLSTTDVGRRVPAEEDAVSEVSEAELGEWEEEQGAEAGERGAGGELDHCPPHARLHGDRGQGLGGFICPFPFFFSFVISLVRATFSWVRPGRRAKGSLQRAATARTVERKRTVEIPDLT